MTHQIRNPPTLTTWNRQKRAQEGRRSRKTHQSLMPYRTTGVTSAATRLPSRRGIFHTSSKKYRTANPTKNSTIQPVHQRPIAAQATPAYFISTLFFEGTFTDPPNQY